MIKDLQVTLYDVFGYIIPGVVFAAALSALFIGCFVPVLEFATIPRGPWSAVACLVLAYICGHAAQAIGNVLSTFFPVPEDEALAPNRSGTQCPAIFVEASRKKMAEILQLSQMELSPRWFYRACDAAAGTDRTTERDLYTYREGFYRGMTIASLLWLIVAIFLLGRRWVKYPPTRLVFPHGAFEFDIGVLVFSLLLATAATYLFFVRYRRFAAYRVSAALLGFLFSATPAAGKETQAPPPGNSGQ